MAVDVDLLLTELTLSGPLASARLVEAITAPPVLERTLDGASTLKVDVRDTRRALVGSRIFDAPSWAVVDGLHFDLVAVAKSGDTLALTFEDSVVAALRRRTSPRAFAAGTATRAQIAALLTGEAQVPLDVDPAGRGVVSTAVERSAGGQVSDSWAVLGTLAEGAGWRRFSDGARVVLGSDDWLAARHPLLGVREHTGPVHDVDWDLDVGQPVSTATLDVDATRWATPPGQGVDLAGQGPASGRWLVEKVTRPLTRQRSAVSLVRGRAVLAEAPPEPAVAAASERGEPDFLPDAPAGAPARAPAGGSAAVERMISYALAQRGKPYVWGGSGPRGFDCSGLVQEATRAGGRTLVKPSKSQWATLRAKGRVIGVAEALRTRGAILYRGNTEPTHIGISLGDGTTIEARGRAYGIPVVRRPGTGGWTNAATWL